MALFKKKPDPLGERARDLNAELAALEVEIKKLNTQRAQIESQPRLRSTAVRGSGNESRAAQAAPAPPSEPIFEDVNQERVKVSPEPAAAHYNDLGVRKYDLAAAWRRWLAHFHGQSSSNPKLISYLAAGSIQGLRPLRYEKRIARNRFIGMFLLFFFALWGLVAYFLRHH